MTTATAPATTRSPFAVLGEHLSPRDIRALTVICTWHELEIFACGFEHADDATRAHLIAQMRGTTDEILSLTGGTTA